MQSLRRRLLNGLTSLAGNKIGNHMDLTAGTVVQNMDLVFDRFQLHVVGIDP